MTVSRLNGSCFDCERKFRSSRRESPWDILLYYGSLVAYSEVDKYDSVTMDMLSATTFNCGQMSR